MQPFDGIIFHASKEYVVLPSERDDVLESKWPLVDVRVGKKLTHHTEYKMKKSAMLHTLHRSGV